VLVIQAPSIVLNPTLDVGVIASAQESDPFAATSEWLGEFRSDLSSFLDDEIVEAAVDRDRPLELPPRPGVQYHCFVDPSGGRHDAFVAAIGHVEEGLFVCDALRARVPPFDPAEVVAEFARLARDYGLARVTGDNYSAEWTASAFRARGVEYYRSTLSKSQLYLEGLPAFARGLVSIPAIPKLVRELKLLTRRTHRSGRDSVDHAANASDDHANALFGAMQLVLAPREVPRAVVLSWEGDRARPRGPTRLQQEAAHWSAPCTLTATQLRSTEPSDDFIRRMNASRR
jgi:hypothetical protein